MQGCWSTGGWLSRTTATCSQASRPSGMTAPIARFHGHTASAAGLSAQSTKSVQGNQRCGWLRVSPRIESGGRLMLSRTNPGHRGTSGVLCAAFLGQRWSCNVQRPPGCNARMVGGAGLRKERGPKSKAASGLPGETPKGCGRKLPYGSARSPAGSWNTGGRLIALTHRTHEMLRVDGPSPAAASGPTVRRALGGYRMRTVSVCACGDFSPGLTRVGSAPFPWSGERGS